MEQVKLYITLNTIFHVANYILLFSAILLGFTINYFNCPFIWWRSFCLFFSTVLLLLEFLVNFLVTNIYIAFKKKNIPHQYLLRAYMWGMIYNFISNIWSYNFLTQLTDDIELNPGSKPTLCMSLCMNYY